MATLEAGNHEELIPTPTPTIPEGENPTLTTNPNHHEFDDSQISTPKEEVLLTDEQAIQMVNEFINSPDTKDALINLKKIEELYKSNALPVNISESYKKARKEIMDSLQDDSKNIMKLMGFNFDNDTLPSEIDNNAPLPEIPTEQANNRVRNTLENPSTKEDIILAVGVMNRYDKLNEPQKVALNSVMLEIKQSLENDSTIQELLGRYKNDYKKAA